MSRDLPAPLRKLVKWSVAELGQVIKSELGTVAFKRIDDMRIHMKSLRSSTSERKHELTLSRALKTLRGLDSEEQFAFAHSFALMLELMNACENAYRTFRLQQELKPLKPLKTGRITFVLTAHPTEARCPQCIEVFQDILDLLLQALQQGPSSVEKQLRHLLRLAWRIPMARKSKPSVEDEAIHIYSILLRAENIEQLIRFHKSDVPVYVRTWVGGDKDGHPGVDAAVMQNSLNLSRQRLLAFIQQQVENADQHLQMLTAVDHSPQANHVRSQLSDFKKSLDKVSIIGSADGEKILHVRKVLEDLSKSYTEYIGEPAPEIEKLEHLIEIFPALVVPLELREASDLIHASLNENTAITGMLQKLKSISKGANPAWYARGLVISMTESAADIRAGLKLVEREITDKTFPVIPLFENELALTKAATIIDDLMSRNDFKNQVHTSWGSSFEVMVGYSDSAKENGSFASRALIEQALFNLERTFKKHKITPTYFHGSGGSVERGGGSLEEQTSWWPTQALRHFKATIQGEMVYRSFATPEILYRQVEKITERVNSRSKKTIARGEQKVVQQFTSAIAEKYRSQVSSPEFMELVEKTTPYRYLQHLRIGSRPTKRGSKLSLESLRAIPWTLCWTQTRVLFPAWWGVGAAWNELTSRQRNELKRQFAKNDLLRSYTKLLGFTVAKIELYVWRVYLEQADISAQQRAQVFKQFKRELTSCKQYIQAVSKQKSLLWYRPWLQRSISLRSPMIHPLNLLQLIALEKNDDLLLRETVTGIASGMLTTG